MEKADIIWASLTTQCERKKPCIIENSLECHNRWNDYKCVCKEGFVGKDCDENLITSAPEIQTEAETTRAPETEPEPEPTTTQEIITQPQIKDDGKNFDIICDDTTMSVKLRATSSPTI